MTVELNSNSLAATARFGALLAEKLQPGDIVLLDGPLGAGKTALVKGFVTRLDPDVERLVSSQSYVVVGEYPARPPVVHLDLYRLSSTEEVLALGYEELLYGEERFVMIEWPELLEPLLEADDAVLRLELSHGEKPDQRHIVASSTNARINALLIEMARGPHSSGLVDSDRRKS